MHKICAKWRDIRYMDCMSEVNRKTLLAIVVGIPFNVRKYVRSYGNLRTLVHVRDDARSYFITEVYLISLYSKVLLRLQKNIYS